MTTVAELEQQCAAAIEAGDKAEAFRIGKEIARLREAKKRRRKRGFHCRINGQKAVLDPERVKELMDGHR